MFYKYIEHLSIFNLILYNSTLYFIKCFIKVWEYYLKFFKQSISSLLVLCRSLSQFQCCNPKMDQDQTNTRRAWMHSIYRTSHPASTLCSEPTPCRPCNRRPFISILRVLFYCLHFLHCHVMSGCCPPVQMCSGSVRHGMYPHMGPLYWCQLLQRPWHAQIRRRVSDPSASLLCWCQKWGVSP